MWPRHASEYVLSHSKEQALATQIISIEENVARHTVPDCRGRTTDSKSKGRRKWKKKREHFVKLTLRNENHVTSLQALMTHANHILTELLSAPATGTWLYKLRPTTFYSTLFLTHFSHRSLKKTRKTKPNNPIRLRGALLTKCPGVVQDKVTQQAPAKSSTVRFWCTLKTFLRYWWNLDFFLFLTWCL